MIRTHARVHPFSYSPGINFRVQLMRKANFKSTSLKAKGRLGFGEANYKIVLEKQKASRELASILFGY